MLSVKHHLAFLALSSTAAAVYYVLTSILSVSEATLQWYLMPPASAYLLYILWYGPGFPVPTIAHRIATGFMLVALGPFSTCLQVPEPEWKVPEDHVQRLGVLVHTLSAFVLLAVVESIRNNTTETSPANLLTLFTGPRTQFRTTNWYRRVQQAGAMGVFWIIFVPVYAVVEIIIIGVCGVGTTLFGLMRANNARNPMKHPGSTLMCYILAGALADIAETIYYEFCRRKIPDWPEYIEKSDSLDRMGWATDCINVILGTLSGALYFFNLFSASKSPEGQRGPERHQDIL